jgi:hypothetical protein
MAGGRFGFLIEAITGGAVVKERREEQESSLVTIRYQCSPPTEEERQDGVSGRREHQANGNQVLLLAT